eukprot:m.152200 g.152200  ORF g.152200 m.152200 type:complete len:181 (+) comp13299_c6_seq4:90-632(+)
MGEVDLFPSLELELKIEERAKDLSLSAEEFVATPEDEEETTWIYELMRHFMSQFNDLVVLLEGDCKCSKMEADGTEFLCACHQPPKECDAMSYMMHSLHSAESTITSEHHFPSRYTIKANIMRKTVSSLCRRLYRILGHAFFNHRPVFDEFEENTKMHERFVEFAFGFKLVSQEHLFIPL